MQPLDILRHSPLFKGVPSDTLDQFVHTMVPEIWPRHATLLTGAHGGQRFVFLTGGRVKIARSNGQDGRELTLWLLSPGDGFDVVTLLDGEPHEVSAHTLDEVHGFSAPVSLVRTWMTEQPAFRLAVHRYAAAQLRELADLAADLALHDTATRLARLLLRYLGHAQTQPAQAHLIDDLPHDELAAMIGSVRVVVNRLLGRLRRASIVTSEAGRLRVLDLQRLAEQAGTLEHQSHAAAT